MTLFTRTVFLDDTSILSKLDPGTWPERYGHIECRTSHDEIAQASEHFLSCRFDPDDLEAVSRSVSSMELRDRGARLQSVRQTPPEGTE
jgi:hypothetical protein